MLTLKNIQNYSFDENQYEIYETNYDNLVKWITSRRHKILYLFILNIPELIVIKSIYSGSQMKEPISKCAHNVMHRNRTKMNAFVNSHRTFSCTKCCRKTIGKLNLEEKMREYWKI